MYGFKQPLTFGDKIISFFDTVCTVHRNQLYKQTNKMHFRCVFILQFPYNSTCFERPFLSSSAVHDLLYQQLCTNHAHGLHRAAEYSKSWTPDERNGRSKHVEL